MYKTIFTFFLAMLTLSSCTMTEEMVIKENSELEYIQKIDMPQLAAVMNTADIDTKIEKNQISNTEYSYLDFILMLQEVGGESTKEKLAKFLIYKDELAELDFLKLRLDLRNKFTIEVINRSKSVEEFNKQSAIIERVFADINQKEKERILIESTQKKKKRKKAKAEIETPVFSDNPMATMTSSNFTFDGKTFTKTLDAENFSKDFNLDDLNSDEEKQLFIGMLKQIKFQYKYTFPRKIKSLTFTDAMFTADGKSFVKEFSLEEIVNNPSLGDFKVELED